MYWNNVQSSSQIDILNKEDLTLTELLNEDNILQECINNNMKLVEFLTRPEVMSDLISLITEEPSNDNDERLRYRYSHLASEILTCNITSLNEKLAQDNVLLDKMYAFLEREPPLNPLLASYFSKTLTMLISPESQQGWYSGQVVVIQVLEFLKSKGNFITLLLKHLGTSAIMDLLLTLVTKIEGTMRTPVLNWLKNQKLIENLIKLLGPSIDAERQYNIAELFYDIIDFYRTNMSDQTMQEKNFFDSSNSILDTIETPETISLILDTILVEDESKSETSIINGIQIILSLMEFKTNQNISNFEDESYQKNEQYIEKVFKNITTAILPRLKDFNDLLLNPPKREKMMTTVGALDPPLGNLRIEVTRLIAKLLSLNNPELNEQIHSLDTINILIDLFFKYSWNNFLHSNVTACVLCILQNGTCANNQLLNNIFVECRLIDRILEVWTCDEKINGSEKSIRKGYMGHLIKIINAIIDEMKKNESFKMFLKDNLSAENFESWEQFISNKISEINRRQNTIIGGIHPKNLLTELVDDYSFAHFQENFPSQNIYDPQNRAVAMSDFQIQGDEIQQSSFYQFAKKSNEKFVDRNNENNDSDDDYEDFQKGVSKMSVFEKELDMKLDEEDDDDNDNFDTTINSWSYTNANVVLDNGDPWASQTNENNMNEGWANFEAILESKTSAFNSDADDMFSTFPNETNDLKFFNENTTFESKINFNFEPIMMNKRIADNDEQKTVVEHHTFNKNLINFESLRLVEDTISNAKEIVNQMQEMKISFPSVNGYQSNTRDDLDDATTEIRPNNTLSKVELISDNLSAQSDVNGKLIVDNILNSLVDSLTADDRETLSTNQVEEITKG